MDAKHYVSPRPKLRRAHGTETAVADGVGDDARSSPDISCHGRKIIKSQEMGSSVVIINLAFSSWEITGFVFTFKC